MCTRRVLSRERGVTLFDLIMFIVIVGVAVSGIATVISLNTQHTADPLVEKQALAIAEALLEEVELMPFTNCASSQTLNPISQSCDPATGTKTRGSMIAPFDNVLDYNGFTLASGGADVGNSGFVTVPPGYSATVAVGFDSSFGQSGAIVPNSDVVLITVTVNYPGGKSLKLEGYRTKYAPFVTS